MLTQSCCSPENDTNQHQATTQVTHDQLILMNDFDSFFLFDKGQNPLHSFPVASPYQIRSKSVTTWRGQKSVVSVVSCGFPNSITTTCNVTRCRSGKLVGNLFDYNTDQRSLVRFPPGPLSQ